MDSGDGFHLERLGRPSPRRAEALRLVLGHPGDSSAQAERRVQHFCEFLGAQSLRIGSVLGASQRGALISAVALVESPGGLGAVLIPAAHGEEAHAPATVALLRTVQQIAWRRPLAMLQALVDHRDAVQANVLAAGGFQFLAELIYLERSAHDAVPHGPLPHDLKFLTFTPSRQREFVEVLSLTYRDSKDCPKLGGMRRAEDILATHRATGLHDPAWWSIATGNGAPAGVLLLSGVHGRPALEVVYMGVVPSFRGQGVGQALLARAVETCRRHGDADLTLAVDRQNTPARRLYQRWSFREVLRRRAWFLPRPADP